MWSIAEDQDTLVPAMNATCSGYWLWAKKHASNPATMGLKKVLYSMNHDVRDLADVSSDSSKALTLQST